MILHQDWTIINCIRCKALFAFPNNVHTQYMQNHKDFCCPYCKETMYYVQETDAEKYKRLAEEKDRCCTSAMEEADNLERRVRAYKGVVTKLKRGMR